MANAKSKRTLIAGASVAALAAVGGGAYVATTGGLGGSSTMSAATASGLVDRYCVECHNDAELTANLSLEGRDFAAVAHDAAEWEPAIRKLRAGMMPPPGARRPAPAEYAALTAWLETEIDRAAPAAPGTKVLHRLNRTEYENAIRDLLALDIDAAKFLPADDSSRGFDNVAGSLTISPTCSRPTSTRPRRSRAWR
jgi:hypothetical protein